MKFIDFLLPKRADLEEMKRIQERVAKMVIKRDKFDRLETVAGCDVSFERHAQAYAACVLLRLENLEVLDSRAVKVRVDFPYIPTFLAFRELKPMLEAINGMDASVYMVGAQGLAHPRRAGLASHLGVILDKPTVGVAKSKLCGTYREPGPERGAREWLIDKGEIIGAAVRTVRGKKPVIVSIGHKVSLETAIELTLKTTREGPLPEPILKAHTLATQVARKEFG